jgi:CTP:molybdopterin cytidylyltransferase MocA
MAQPVDTVVLAGGVNRIRLFAGDRPGYKALVPLGGRTFLQRALAAARESTAIRRLIVAAPPEVCAAARREGDCLGVDSGESLLANLRAAARAAETPRVLFMTADLPLIRGPMIDEFAQRALAVEADLAAAVVNRERLGPYAATHKPFLRFADGWYQHGNLFMIPRASLEQERVWRPLDRLYRARKNGLATAAVLGPRLLWWFAVDVLLFHRPTLHEAADHVSRAVGAEIAVVESSYPEVMLDVDEPEDYALAARFVNG